MLTQDFHRLDTIHAEDTQKVRNTCHWYHGLLMIVILICQL